MWCEKCRNFTGRSVCWCKPFTIRDVENLGEDTEIVYARDRLAAALNYLKKLYDNDPPTDIYGFVIEFYVDDVIYEGIAELSVEFSANEV